MNEPNAPPPSGNPAPAGRPSPSAVPRKRGRGLLAAAIVLAAIAAVLAYYSVRLWDQQRTARAELRNTKQAVAELKVERTRNVKRDKKQKKRLEELHEELSATRVKLTNVQQRLGELKRTKGDIDKEMRAFKEMVARFQRMIDTGQLEVTIRRGRMVVDLPAKVLFPTGSAELSDEGLASLREVAKILRKVRGKRFIVGGHTDTVRINNEQYSSNWALSAARAVTVTEALLRFGMRPRNLVAAGYGPHDPVARNRTAKGRQRNRRIEIMLEPKVRELPERLEDRL